MDQSQASDAVKKRLAMQNEKISNEHELVDHMRQKAQNPAHASIPAQDYVADILPRYKEALSLALTSGRKYLQSKGKSQFPSSFFLAGSMPGTLPHVIGSEEYIHDNTCGLTENFASKASIHDFSMMMKSRGTSSVDEEHNSSELFGTSTIDKQESSSEKVIVDPLASAALDFKAMLEAALRNQYNFYDDESLTPNDVTGDDNSITRKSQVEGVEKTMEQVALLENPELNVAVQMESPALEPYLQDIDSNVKEFYSALATGSLFDAEEDSSLPDETSEKEAADNVFTAKDSISGLRHAGEDVDSAESSH